MIGMLRRNPTRSVECRVTCARGEDLFNMRWVVWERVTAIIKKRKLTVHAAQCFSGAALQCRLSAAPLEPASSSSIQDQRVTVKIYLYNLSLDFYIIRPVFFGVFQCRPPPKPHSAIQIISITN